MSEYIPERILTLCNGFWYFLILAAIGLIVFVLLRWDLYAHSWFALVYLGVPLILIAVALFTVRVATPIHRVNFTVFMFSILLPIFFIEIYLDQYSYVDIRAIKALASGVKVDPRYEKTQVIEDLQKEGRQAYPTIHPGYLIHEFQSDTKGWTLRVHDQDLLPLGGISNVTTIYNRESGKWVIYESDEYGFRNPVGIWDSDEIDLVILGDSFGHGAGLTEGKDIGFLLRKAFPKTINLANGGNGPLLVLASLREYAKKLKPRFVIYLYYEGNDLKDLNTEKKVPLLMSYLKDTKWNLHLYEKQEIIDSVLINYCEKKLIQRQTVRLRQIFTLSNLRARLGLRVIDVRQANGGNAIQPDLTLFKEVLNQMKNEVQQWGGTFIMAYLPAWDRYKYPRKFNGFRNEVLHILKHNDIFLIDIHPVFKQQKDVFSLFHFGLDGHYNSIGAKLFAQEIVHFLHTPAVLSSRRP